MNSIDAANRAYELLVAVFYHSDNINFDWPKWEEDVKYLLANHVINDERFNSYRIAMRYVQHGEGGNIVPHKKMEIEP